MTVKPAVLQAGDESHVEWLSSAVTADPENHTLQRGKAGAVRHYTFAGTYEVVQEELGKRRDGKVTFRAHRAPVFTHTHTENT